MPRFVILEHDHPVLHWDLMLEAGEVLQTWRLAKPPLQAGCVIEATALPDHRRLYLDYEGPVSANRGTVQRWDAGTYGVETDDAAEVRCLWLEGSRVRGRVVLECVKESQWRLQWFVRA